jgi:hypothetical protein
LLEGLYRLRLTITAVWKEALVGASGKKIWRTGEGGKYWREYWKQQNE